MLLPTRRAHLRPVPREQERRREHDLRLEAVRLHHRAPGEQVVELVGAAELDVRLDRDRVVRLHERVEQLGDRDRVPGGDPLREVVALEQLGHGQRPRQAHDVGEGELREPLAVEPHLGAVRVEDLHRLVDVRPARSRSISSSERIGRSAERPDGSPIRVV